MNPINQREELLANAGWVVRAKLVICGLLLVIFGTARYREWLIFPFLPFALAPLLEMFVNQPHHWLIRKFKDPERVFDITSMIDVVAITWAAHFLGDMGAFTALLIYPLVFIYAGVMQPWKTFFFANWCFFCFVVLSGLEYFGIVSQVASLKLPISGLQRLLITLLVLPLYNSMAFFVRHLSVLLRKREKQLIHSAFHDELTGLASRDLFMERLKQAMTRAQSRKDYMFAVLFLDLDRFKIVNNSLDHVMGDKLLIEAARRISGCVKTVDTVARMGGDEFTILAEDISDILDAARVAERIQDELKLPFSLSGHEVFTTASIGISISTSGYTSPENMLRDAHTAMYRAKADGRARHEVFDAGMRPHVVEQLDLESDLRRAVERQEFCLYFQPIYELPHEKLSGFEALIRWNHPSRGMVDPNDFIPIAEETGLIIPIGVWVLRSACLQIRRWHEQFETVPPLTVSVNLSGEQFKQDHIGEKVLEILKETEVDPKRLKLEITESVLIENPEATIADITELQDRHVEFYMDDFGTGYSSLSYLRRFNVDKLKIDQSFIHRLEKSGKDLEIVRNIILLAHGLEMGVIAEGVETASQRDHLMKMGCDYGQGYFFSKPLDCEAAESLIRKQK